MNKIARKIAKWFSRAPIKNAVSVSRCLDADSQSYVGTIPTMPAGAGGHLAMLDIYFELMVLSKPAIFCDIGANKGEAGRRALALRPDMKVFGFEANPKIHSQYEKINVDSGVHWINCAIADQNGKLVLYVPKILARALKGEALVSERIVEAEDTGKSSLLKRDENAEYESVEVPAVALDKFLLDQAPEGRVALWIDVEGAASLVLKGANETLARTDIVIIEVEGFGFWQDQALVMQIMDVLYSHGFVPVLRDREYQDAQFNIIFLRGSDNIALQQRWIGNAISDKKHLPATRSMSDQSLTKDSVPVLVPCFNNPSYSENMLNQLQAIGLTNITFVDNASTSPSMHRWLEKTIRRGVQVERLTENLGPRESIFTDARLAHLPRWFCVTDPDLQFNPALPEDFLDIMVEAMNTHSIAKIGFALDISNRQHLRQDKFDIDGTAYHIWEWERKFWEENLSFTSTGDSIYKADVDTTFALYDLKKFKKTAMMKSLRIGGHFTAEHLPWLPQSTMLKEEEEVYRASQKFSYYVR
jgi:FkbM family methyltransferase